MKDENKTLQAKIQKAQCSSEQMEKTEKVAKLALQTANRNEQYSRKNNFKIMDIKESDMETEASLRYVTCLQSKVSPLTEHQISLFIGYLAR